MVILQTINQLYGLFMFKCRWVGWSQNEKKQCYRFFVCVYNCSCQSKLCWLSFDYAQGWSVYHLYSVAVNASPSIVSAVIEDFVFQTKYDLEALFGWGLKNLKLRRESDEVIVFNFKSTQYDKNQISLKLLEQ